MPDDAERPAPPSAAPRWTAGRVIGMILSSFTGLIGFALLLAGLALLAAHAFARDDDGFYTTSEEELRSADWAITTDEINLGDADLADDVPDDVLGTVRVRAESSSARPLFLGIGRTADVQAYLGRVGRSELVDFDHGAAVYRRHPGGPPRGRPATQPFWEARSEGTGERRIDWDPDAGAWTVAVMNADGSRGIAVEADIGAEIDWLIWAGLGLALIGAALTATAIVLVVAIGRRASRSADADGARAGP